MTKEDQRHQNWVAARADCTPQGMFDLIADTIECDVRRFNNLPEKKRLNRRFSCSRPEVSKVTVSDTGEGSEWPSPRMGIVVQKNSTKFRVRRGDDLMFEIEHEWNEEAIACDLKVDGKVLSASQISQRALCKLLFGPE